jgi:hypothetical protein
MICPSCKCEYIRGVTQCADCGVPLVDTLDPEGGTIPKDGHIVAVWRGTDPGECEKVSAALDIAEIPYTRADAKSLFGPHPNELTLEIWVSDADCEKANQIVGDLDDSSFPEELTPEEAAALTLPESDEPGEDDESAQDLSEEWNDEDPVSEVWSGDSEVFADNLIMCLREVGIAARNLSGEGSWRVQVRPAMESRAKKIVSEVVEARPLE